MKFPALLIFNDGSIKLVENEANLNGNIDWSSINYEGGDILINESLEVGRFSTDGSEERFFAKLQSSNIISSSSSLDELNTIAKKLKKLVETGKGNENEIKMCRSILTAIECNAEHGAQIDPFGHRDLATPRPLARR